MILCGGDRHTDMALRLKVAGIAEDKLTQSKELTDVIEKIKQLPTDHVYILATYTAVLQLRKELASQGFYQRRHESWLTTNYALPISMGI